MSLPNIQRFNEYTGAILASLYDHFPIRKSLLPKNFIEGGAAAVMVPDDIVDERLSDEAVFFMETVRWLVEAGYVQCEKVSLDHASEATLTAKALEALNAVPESLSGKQSLGERLIGAARDGGKHLLRTVAQEAISAGLKAGLKSITM